MDNICLPVRYDIQGESELREHLLHSAGLAQGKTAEFLLSEVGVVIPVVKREYRTKPPVLEIVVRSGSVGRVRLATLSDQLSSAGYALKVSFTHKRMILRRISVPLSAADWTIAVTGLDVFRIIASATGAGWPCSMGVGYAVGCERPGLPGRFTYHDPLRNAGYRVGLAVGKLIRRIIPPTT